MRARRSGARALLLAALWLLLAAAPVWAQEAPPDPPGPRFPGAQEFADAVLRGLGDVLTTTLDTWWDQSGPVVFGRLVTVAFGAMVAWVWAAVGPVLAAVDFFTRIPPQWSYELAPLVQLRDRLTPLGSAVVLLGLVLTILWGVVGLVTGRPFSRLLRAAPTFLLATGALLVAPRLMVWWIQFCNAASGALLAPGTGLPALREMEAVDRVSALGVIALVYLLFALWFLILRIKLLGLAVVLLGVAPLAIAAGALPFPQAQRFFSWWLTTFLATTFVQVLQAFCLAVGGWMVAQPVVTGGAPSDAARDLLTAAIGAGVLAAAAGLPPLLLGSLARAGVGGPSVNTALYVGSLLAGFGGAAAFKAAAHQVAHYTPALGAVAPAAGAAASPASGHVRSLLGSAPLALPPPK